AEDEDHVRSRELMIEPMIVPEFLGKAADVLVHRVASGTWYAKWTARPDRRAYFSIDSSAVWKSSNGKAPLTTLTIFMGGPAGGVAPIRNVGVLSMPSVCIREMLFFTGAEYFPLSRQLLN